MIFPFNADNCDATFDAATADRDAVGYLSLGDSPGLPELPAVRPPVAGIRVPRSAKRPYAEGELRAAACMMDKLRAREDLRALAAARLPTSPIEPVDPLDVAVDRLLRVL